MNILELAENYRIIDISQPVTSKTACFPGDTPFHREITVSYLQGNALNLTAITMSPHVGTHADAPIHIYGDMTDNQDTAGCMPVEQFIGNCYLIDIAPFDEEINVESVSKKLQLLNPFPSRILFKTRKQIRYETFEDKYASFSVQLVEYLASNGVFLMGIDSQSVDHISSKNLPVHNSMLKCKMVWLENLDLSHAEEGSYFLIALPLKFMEVEASPVRAVLLAPT